MAHFYGTAKGSRGEGSRIGHSHLFVTAASREGYRLEVALERSEGGDWITIDMVTHPGGQHVRHIFGGTWQDLERTPRLADLYREPG